MQPNAGQIGLNIIYQVQDANGQPRDISSFTTTELIFLKPNRTKLIVPVDFQGDGTDGELVYVTEEGDLEPYGTFEVQSHLAKLNVDEYTEVSLFSVSKNL